MILLLLLILLVPALEIYLFVKIGSEIGALSTVLLTILTAIGGVYVVQLQGLNTLRNAQTQLNQQKAPSRAVFDGICIACAGLMLLLPGFFTDFLGVLLLIPPFRTFLLQFGRNLFVGSFTGGWVDYDDMKDAGTYAKRKLKSRKKPSKTVDIDYEIIDKKED